MPELLDYVNDNDEVIGQATREEIHANGWKCRIIQIFVVNDEGKILTQWRAGHKSQGAHIFDSSVGGHVDVGETYEEAAYREMQEEIGIKEPLEFISNIIDVKSGDFAQLFLTHSNGPFTNWEEEADALEWFSVDEIENLMERLPYIFTGGIIPSFKAYKKHLKKQK